MKNFNLIKLLGMAGMAMGTIATVVSGYVQKEQMKQLIKEEVAKAVTKE